MTDKKRFFKKGEKPAFADFLYAERCRQERKMPESRIKKRIVILIQDKGIAFVSIMQQNSDFYQTVSSGFKNCGNA